MGSGGVRQGDDAISSALQKYHSACSTEMNWRVTQEDAVRPVRRLLLTREGSCVDQGGGVENGEE